MPLITLTNPDTAAAFESLTEFDQFVDVPARIGQGTCYRGKISGITPEAAERYVRFGGNLIARKQQGFSPEVLRTATKIVLAETEESPAEEVNNIDE